MNVKLTDNLEARTLAPVLVAGLAFVVLFQESMTTLVRDWWNDPDAAHGLLLGPLALFLAWKAGLVSDRRPAVRWGLAVLAAAVLLRYMAGLAAELFTLRMSMLMALGGIVLFLWGWRQVRHWWLPIALLALAVPIPSVILNSLAIPLQLKASAMGASLLEMRDVPVLVAGNVIHIPGQSLFVTEACSGLRSLTALLSLGLLCGGLWLTTPVGRALLLAVVIPVAIAINGVRVFLTGFLVYFVDPSLGEGFMHYTEGWALFVISFALLMGATWGIGGAEAWVRRLRERFRARRAAAAAERPEPEVQEALA